MCGFKHLKNKSAVLTAHFILLLTFFNPFVVGFPLKMDLFQFTEL